MGGLLSHNQCLKTPCGCACLCTVLVMNGWAFSGKNLKNRSQVSPASVRRKVNAEWLVFSSVMWSSSHLVQSECSSCTCVEVLPTITLICVYLRVLFWRFPFSKIGLFNINQLLLQPLVEVNIDNPMNISTWMRRSHHLHLCLYLFSCYLDYRPAQTSQGP